MSEMNGIMCQECGINPANVHLTQIADGRTVVSHLCEACARKHGVHVVLSPSSDSSNRGSETAEPDRECRRCGLKFSEFREHGRLGCVACYQCFEKEVDELLVQVHGATAHTGKRYSARGSSGENHGHSVEGLRNALRAAVNNEEFELAASIRDQLRSIAVRTPGEENHVSP